ncbi:MAG: hypothetical protein PVG64_08975, partial [Syntrophobacterales bacterium]
ASAILNGQAVLHVAAEAGNPASRGTRAATAFVRRTRPRKGSRPSVSGGNGSAFKRSCGVKATGIT